VWRRTISDIGAALRQPDKSFDHLAGAGEQYGQHLDAKALELAVGVIGGSSGRPIPAEYLFALTICKGLSSPLHTRDGAPRLIQSAAVKPRSIDNKSALWITS